MSKSKKKLTRSAGKKGATGWPVGKAASTRAEKKAVATTGLTVAGVEAAALARQREEAALAARKQAALEAAAQSSAPRDRQQAVQTEQPNTEPEACADGQGGHGGTVPPQPPVPASSETPVPQSPQDMQASSGAASPAASGAASEQGQPQSKDAGNAEEPRPQTLMDHLNELRFRLVRCAIAVCVGFLLCWAVVDPIFDALVAPLLAVLPKGSHAIYTTLPEGFFTRMYIAFVAGVFISSPVLFYQIWAFIAPGLYDSEKRYIVPVAICSAIFFIAGGAFCYIVVFPYAFSFFVSFATESIVAMPKVSDYLGFVLKLILAFGLIFEMPLSAFFLARMGLVTADLMRRVRRYAILVIFIVAAILTPPDVVSQLLMAGPMILLYETSILVAAVFGRRKDKADTPPAEADGTSQHKETA